MAAIITSATGTFTKLVSEGQVGKVTNCFHDAIVKSFVTHPMRHMTQQAVKERFDICASVFVKLRGDKKWSVQRACDHVAMYLVEELDGKKDWHANVRACWMPGDD